MNAESKPTIKGGEFGSIQKVKASLKKASNAFIKQIPANDVLLVRFLEEPDKWYGYYERYDEEVRAYYPVLESESFPSGDRKPSFRYLANVIDLGDDKVIPLKMPKDLANRLFTKYERNHTILDRDYELSRTGEGLETVYDCTPEPPSKKDVRRYKLMNLEQVLLDAHAFVFGGLSDDTEESELLAAASSPNARLTNNKTKTTSRNRRK